MLFPVTSTQQPFRFVALPASDQSALQAAFQSAFYRNTGVQTWNAMTPQDFAVNEPRKASSLAPLNVRFCP